MTSVIGHASANTTTLGYNLNTDSFTSTSSDGTEQRRTPTEEFWERNVLELTSGVEDPGNVRWQLLLCLLASWIVVFLCLIKGIKSSGKVMYVAATVPYLFLLILLVRGATLDGALDGFLYYVIPKWEKLGEFSVWGDAAVQMFYSAGIGWGGISTLASYNDFHNNVARDAIILPILDCLTSWFAGCVIFVNLGYMAHVSGLEIGNVVKEGPGIAFMVYPEALSQLPIPQFWSVLFFLMLFTVGLDSQLVHVQTITSALIDSYPRQLMHRKLLVTGVVCFVMCILGISCVTQGGVYFLQILDWYCASIAVMCLALMETVGLAWVYGIKRFVGDIEIMVGRKISKVWRLFWQFITPVIIVLIWVFNLSQLKPVKYGDVTYPDWAIAFGWIIAFAAIIPIPICMVKKLCELDGGLLERLRKALKPSPDWGPADPVKKEEYAMMYKRDKYVSDIGDQFV